MIEESFQPVPRLRRLNPFRKPTIVALFAYRYDAQLVPDMLENIRPFVDGWIAWDDRKRQELWYHEGKIRRLLIEEARARGADWVLCIDPDERYEAALADRIRKLVRTRQDVVWGFPFRELYTLDAYRVDGVWGQKVRWNLFPLKDNQEFMELNVHSEWCPQNRSYQRRKTDINLYHLKMIDEKNRADRANLYKKIDTSKIQDIGYDYLMDESGMELQPIPAGKQYIPRYEALPEIRQHDHRWADGE